MKRNIVWTAAGCILFLALPFVLSMRPPEEPFFAITRPLVRDVTTNAMILLFFFINFYVLIPRFYFPKKYLIYGAFIVIGFCSICLLPSLITGRFFDPAPPKPSPFGPPHMGTTFLQSPSLMTSFFLEIRHSMYLFIGVVLFSILMRVRIRLLLVEEERIKAELTSLKNQINPHFLFNTLNSIYALAVKRDNKTADAVINLSGLMRYIIKDAQGNKIPLEKELDYLTNYVELQEARLGNTAVIAFTKSGNTAGLDIAPLILISFIENAFKYGVNPEERSDIRINITIEGHMLKLAVSNRKVSASNRDLSTGIGLENTRSRLHLLYENKHHLEITEDAENYIVNLSIEL